jgi:hypothetical protein
MDATPFVTAGLNFIRPEHMGTPTPVKIRDARFAPTPFTLEENGFTLASHPTALSREEFYEDALVKERYYPELARGLEQLTGATKAFPILHRLRNGDQSFFFAGKKRGVDRGGSSAAGGATAALSQKCQCLAEFVPLVHCDNTVVQGKEMMQDFLRLNGAHEFLSDFESRRYKIVNVWRNIRREPISASNSPLGLLDSATLRVPEDFVQSMTELPKLSGNKNYHRWWWYSNQTRDEMLVFSRWDSRGSAAEDILDKKTGRPTRCVGLPADRLGISTFHSAFQIENREFTDYLDGFATSGRESVDCLCLLVW